MALAALSVWGHPTPFYRVETDLVGEYLPAVANFTLLAMLAMPIQFRYAIEAGTEPPALALMLASTWLVLRNGSAGSFIVAGLLAGYAVLTRDLAARRDAMGAWELAGNEVRVRQLFADGVSGGASAAALAGTPALAR